MAIGSKVRVYDLAKELKQDTKRIIEELRRGGADVDVPSNHVPKEIADKIRNMYFPKLDVSPKRAVKIIKSSEVSLIKTIKSSEVSIMKQGELSPKQGEEKKIYDCELCKYTCQDSEQLKKHEEWHKEYFVHGLKSKTSIANVSEQNVISQSQGKEKKIYRCTICRNRTYHDLSQFVKHEEWHEKNRVYEERHENKHVYNWSSVNNGEKDENLIKPKKQSSNSAKKLLKKCAYCGKQVFEISIHSKDCLRNPKNIKFNEEVVEIRFEKKEIDHLPYPIEGKKSKKNCPNCGRSLPMAQSNICYDCKDK
jgi:rubrerythrin